MSIKLTESSISKFDSLIQTSLVAGITKLVIEGNKIRGIDEKQQVVIITDSNVPDFNGKSIGINRLANLAARLSLIKHQGDLEITATESTRQTDIAILDLSVSKIKAQFRCASIDTIKGVPKQTSDTFIWEVKINSKNLPIITQAVAAMGSEAVTIASKDAKTVVIELIDTNKDVFTTEISENPIWIGNGSPKSSFCYKYPAKIFVSLLKEALKACDPLAMQLGEGGIITFKVNGFDFYILPTQ
jgi:hypothetical protein